MSHLRKTTDGTWEVRITVPVDCRERLGKTNLTRRLGRISKSEANKLAIPVVAEFQQAIRRARAPDAPSAPAPAIYKDIDAPRAIAALVRWKENALSNAYTRVLNGKAITGNELTRSESDIIEFAKFCGGRARLRAQLESGQTSERGDRLISQLLAQQGMEVDSGHPAMPHLRAQYRAAVLEILRVEDATLETGNFDAVLDLATEGEPAKVKFDAANPVAHGTSVKLADLLIGYANERQPAPDTLRRWQRAFNNLSKHLGHDDASRITPDHIASWKAALLADGKAKAGTVRNTYLAGAKAVFGWAVENRKIVSNPAANITVRPPKRIKLRESGFTPDEAMTILRATMNPKPPKMSDHVYRARRWIPWLCAYSGARVGEVAQLRGCDVREMSGHWIMRVTPEAGRVKNSEARLVPIHAHLIETGFLGMVKDVGAGPLFYRSGCNPNNIASKIGGWVREIGITDEKIQPNHAWRHLWKTRARGAGIEPDARDAIQGHATRTEGEEYGEWTVEALADAMAKFPRFSP